MLPVSRRVLGVCVWFLACGTIGLTICLPKSDLPDEQVVLMGWILATIGFPCTLLGCTVLAGAVYGMMAFGISFPASYPWLGGYVLWAVLSACGAVQWFLIVPWMWKTTKRWLQCARKSKGNSTDA